MGELRIQNLTKVFNDDTGQIVAVDDFSLNTEDGEFVVFVGPSGCGKSTTLRCIAGLETVTEGRIFLDNEDITTQPPTGRDIAMVFQNYALYPHMTAGENMAFGLKMSTNMPRAEIEQQVNETATMMGIEELLDKRPGELSGGQQQRVALGRAIVREPEVFLMDEPLSNLDAKLRTQMRTELQNLQHELDITTIYVTHDQTEAMTMGDRIVILDGGELQQVGTPLKCYHEPANQFVAGFIGSPSMNFFSMSYENSVLQHDAFRYELSQSVRQNLGTLTGDVVLGIRPEAIERADNGGERTVVAPVSVVEPMGDVTHVYFDVDDETYTMSQEGDLVTEVGSQMELRFPEEKIHLFDATTGDAIKTGSVSTRVETTQPTDGSDTGRP
ncbi:sugar ABC transporter ATP-binding protein [Halobacteriales archaeon QS_4_62_28]|nr:MAG: sugar ABC transporter ATP-binding protein [Halobacteriales archaeon QS_4_62_28]